MVLLAAAVSTKSGKAICSRQFVEMSRSRIEGLLAAFPKLLGSGRQHTFVETESVRYVYQPLEKLYMLLITTRTSNILEDLETLRLFSRVIPEYCKNMDESDIIDNAFNLIFAFDEIIALGYRENVNLAQIRTFVEMDSHEEKVYQAVRQTQEREAKLKMKEKAKELQRARQDGARKGGRAGPNYGGMGSQSNTLPEISSILSDMPKQSSYSAPSKPSGPSKALKLGGKNKDVDSFVDQLKSEGEQVVSGSASAKTNQSNIAKSTLPTVPMESVHIHLEEKITLTALRDGGLQNLEIHGMVTLKVSDERMACVKLQIETKDENESVLQTHPNLDKDLFRTHQQLALKNPTKPFPLNTDVGVLKWRYQTQDESSMPLAINCWPSENSSGGCDVNIEYELQQDVLELSDVVISIPILSGTGAPVVNDCEGEYHYDSRKNILEWRLTVIDAENKSGTMEFSAGGKPSDFFPVRLNFVSSTLFCGIKVAQILGVENNEPMKYSEDTMFSVEKYEVV